jgi:hypothetical protein
MANPKSNTNATPKAIPEPVFQRVNWVAPRDQVDSGRYVMLSNIRDLAAGVALALQLVERSNMQVDNGAAPIIGGADAARFTRMSIAAMNWVEASIDEHFDEMIDLSAASRQGVAS